MKRVELAHPTRAATAPEGEGWVHEIKRDGYRMTAVVRDGRVRCYSRNDRDWSSRLPSILADVDALGLSDGQFDGELIAVNAEGRDDFNLLQTALGRGAMQGRVSLAYVAFDVMRVEGVSLVCVPLLERKALLERIVRDSRVSLSTHHQGDGPELFAAAAKADVEGIVSKRADAGYRSGRTRSWLKIMARLVDDFFVVGFMAPRGSSPGGVMLAQLREGELAYAGRVGSGLGRNELAQLRAAVERVAAPGLVPTADLLARSARIQWVRPQVLVRVAYRGWTAEGRLRHPSYKGLRGRLE